MSKINEFLDLADEVGLLVERNKELEKENVLYQLLLVCMTGNLGIANYKSFPNATAKSYIEASLKSGRLAIAYGQNQVTLMAFDKDNFNGREVTVTQYLIDNKINITQE